MDTFWKVFETVTPAGQYIVWPDSYAMYCPAGAIAGERSASGARPVLCRTGDGKGPIPIECD